MCNPETMRIDSMVAITTERFTELVKKEERLSILERVLVNSNYVTVQEVKHILNIKRPPQSEQTEGVKNE